MTLRGFGFLLTLVAGAAVFSGEGGEVVRRTPRWIGSSFPVPEFSREFVVTSQPNRVTLDLAVAGWYELTVNGRRFGEAVLEPAVVAYMTKTPAFKLDITDCVKPGTNEVKILVGPGWYGCRVEGAWRFQDADWIMDPCIRASIEIDGRQAVRTDSTWRQTRSPITFSQFRNGEYYDARLEDEVVSSNATVLTYPPRGAITYVEPADRVKSFELHSPQSLTAVSNGVVRYDFGANIAGWCEIEVKGERGAKVEIDYDELYRTNGMPARGTDWFVRSGKANHDEYVLAGRKDGESWHPRFVYHGLRYAWVRTTGRVEVKSIRARAVGSDFPRVGFLDTDNAAFMRLHDATIRSYCANFVGIPTDCPYREKNGWTADAQLAAETGLWNFDAQRSYRNYLRMIVDTQQANGQVATIVPNSIRYGFAWGTGPAWDAALFEIAWQLYRFRGDLTMIREGYPAMVRYLGYLATQVRDDGTVGFGLGDWCAADFDKLADRDVLETAISVGNYDYAARFADLLGKPHEAVAWREAAAKMRTAFRARFCRGRGHVMSDRSAELALALHYGCVPPGEEKASAKLLVEIVRKNRHRADFGILGAKYVPRILAEYGYADDAFELFIQPEHPGWQSMLKQGDGTLWESFDGGGSHNHIMFGDLSAWAYEYAAGIRLNDVRPVDAASSPRRILVKPAFLRKCNRFSADCRLPAGRVRVRWERDARGRLSLDCETEPKDLPVAFDLPEGVRLTRGDARATASPSVAKLTFLGDAMCTYEMLKAYRRKDGSFDFAPVFRDVKGLLAESDLVFANLETPISADGKDLTAAYASFNSPREFAAAMKDAGVDVVFTANNHCLDRRLAGVAATERALDELGFFHTGMFATRKRAETPLYVTTKGFKLGVLASTYGTNSFDRDNYLDEDHEWAVCLSQRQEIRDPLAQAYYRDPNSPDGRKFAELERKRCPHNLEVPVWERVEPHEKERARIAADLARVKAGKPDLTIFSMHAGGQFNLAATAETKELASFLAGAGADVIVGTHEHCVHGGDFSGVATNRLETYCLGNFTDVYDLWLEKGLWTKPEPRYPAASIAWHVYLGRDAKGRAKVVRNSFSVLRNVKDGAYGRIRVVPMDDLIATERNPDAQRALEEELYEVARRFAGRDVRREGVRREYEIGEGDGK